MSEPTTAVFLTRDELDWLLVVIPHIQPPSLKVRERKRVLLDKLREAQKVSEP